MKTIHSIEWQGTTFNKGEFSPVRNQKALIGLLIKVPLDIPTRLKLIISFTANNSFIAKIPRNELKINYKH